ncbi:MAG: response regulator transcription factor [Methanomicrobiales archaeon]|nr:response regulator transcription factor [Methanomicrobiales archaeon]
MVGGKVLIVEDDRTLLEVLRYNLSKEGYEVLTAADGAAGLETARSTKPDLVILDVMLPKMDGYEVCRILRRETTVPIMMLTAKTEETDRVVGLEVGADDYVTKPFSMRELMARVRAMLRRAEMMKKEAVSGAGAPAPCFKVGEFEIDTARHKVSEGGAVVDLSRMEFALLEFLARNHGQVFSRDHLLEKVWGYDFSGDTRTVDVHVSWLRRKIETDPAHPKHLLTVRGVGYKFEA